MSPRGYPVDSCQLTILWMSNKRCGFAKIGLRHPSLDSLPYPTRINCRRVRTCARSITCQPKEKRLIIFYAWVWGSVPRAQSAPESPAMTCDTVLELSVSCHSKRASISYVFSPVFGVQLLKIMVKKYWKNPSKNSSNNVYGFGHWNPFEIIKIYLFSRIFWLKEMNVKTRPIYSRSLQLYIQVFRESNQNELLRDTYFPTEKENDESLILSGPQQERIKGTERASPIYTLFHR